MVSYYSQPSMLASSPRLDRTNRLTLFAFPFRIMDASMELNYIFVLTAVAILWRPMENAKEYAFVMQLPSMKGGEDGDGEEGEFEMGVVPSAMDEDDDDESDEVIFSDEPNKIDTF